MIQTPTQTVPDHSNLLQLLEECAELAQTAAVISTKVGLPLHDQAFLARQSAAASGAVLRIKARVARLLSHGRRGLAQPF